MQGMENQKSTFQIPLHFRMQIRFHQLDVVAKDLEEENNSKAISWDVLNIFCYHARYWKTNIQVLASSVSTDTAWVIAWRSVFWYWSNCGSKTFPTPGSQIRQGVSKFQIQWWSSSYMITADVTASLEGHFRVSQYLPMRLSQEPIPSPSNNHASIKFLLLNPFLFEVPRMICFLNGVQSDQCLES